MKVRLPKVLCAALLSSLICANSYAEIQADGIDYTHTANGDGTYDSTVKIGEGDIASNSGGTYVPTADGNTVFNHTQLRDVTIEMTGGTITETLSANTYHSNPVDGTVQMTITGGTVATLLGGNHLCTSNKNNYIDSADIDAITINVGGNAVIGEVRGGHLVGTDGGVPTEDFLQKYTQMGDISINVKENASVSTINGSVGTVNGSVNVNVEGGTVTNLHTNNGAEVSGDVKTTISGGNITYLYDILEGHVNGNVSTEITGGYVFFLAGSYGGTIEKNSTISVQDAKVDYIYGAYTANGTIKQDATITIGQNSTINTMYGVINGTVGGNASITTGADSSITYIYGVYGGSVGGNASVQMNDSTVYQAKTVTGGTVAKDANLVINGGTVEYVAVAVDGGTVEGNASTTLNDGTVAYLEATSNGIVKGDAILTINGGTVTAGAFAACFSGNVGGNAILTIDGADATITDLAAGVCYGATVNGNTIVTLKNGKVGYLEGIASGTVKGDVALTIDGGEVTEYVDAVYDGTVEGKTAITVNDGKIAAMYGVTDGSVGKGVTVTINGGEVGNVAGVTGGTINQGGASVTLNGGSYNRVFAVSGGTVNGNVEVTFNEGTVAGTDTENGTITGAYAGQVNGSVTITMNGGTAKNIHAADVGTVTEDTTVYLLGGTVTGNIYGGDADLVGGTRTLYVGSEDKAYNGTINDFYGFDRVIIASGSSLQATDSNCEVFEIKEQQYNVTGDNLKTATITTSGTVSIEDAITLNFNVSKSLRSGRYMLIDATNGTVDTTNWTEENVTINNVTTGTTYNRRAATATGQHTVSFNDLKWIDSILYLFVVAEDLQNTLAGNWGAFKSSQAFVSTLWGGRSNAVVLPGAADGKGGLIPGGQTIAWGRVYGQSSRIGGIGADYSLFGGAIGAEQRFVTGRTLGAAMGYDWGKVTPFGLSRIDQETEHFALYGRAASWKVGQKSNIVIDWSAAVGNTTSETAAINGEWEQKNMQLDARASYLRQMSEKTTGSVFAGVQYFAAEDATAGAVQISSMQNLRTEAGVGLSCKATSKTTVYGEASVYNDAMRHNPTTSANGASYSGTNPGRLGGRVSVGTVYELNDRLNLHGNYSFDMADDSQEHNMNVGASYRF